MMGLLGRGATLWGSTIRTVSGHRYRRSLHTTRSWTEPITSLYARLPHRLRLSLSIGAPVLQIFFLWHLTSIHFFEVRRSTGPSMLPTLFHEGDFLFLIRFPFLKLLQRNQQPQEQLPYKLSKASKSDRLFGLPLQLGDIVVATSPYDPTRSVCKRIVGLPGDRILIDPRVEKPSTDLVKDSADTQLDEVEPHSSTIAATEHGENYITVPPGHVFLVGDNLANSTDSRQYGPVPLGLLRGKVLATLWPNLMRFDGQALVPLPMVGDGE